MDMVASARLPADRGAVFEGERLRGRDWRRRVQKDMVLVLAGTGCRMVRGGGLVRGWRVGLGLARMRIVEGLLSSTRFHPQLADAILGLGLPPEFTTSRLLYKPINTTSILRFREALEIVFYALLFVFSVFL